MNSVGHTIRKCDNCGNEFEIIAACGWAYKTKTKCFCRYNCLREYQRKLTEVRRTNAIKTALIKSQKAEARVCEEIVKEVKDDGCKGVS